ncbi:IclR family transcriptional regulator, partial [Streptomyces anulatus]|uniref:IclR family transcriptional regulator n=1 Tax=Streptomyces anulatus TaxID=1892 RepID=UPI003422BC8B
MQSIERAFELLELLAAADGELSISQLASQSGLPMTTIHRVLRTLAGFGYVRQEPSKIYTLGPRLIHLGATASRLLGAWSRQYLARIAEATGETTNLAVLDADQVVYVAQVPSRHYLRMFTEVGRRVPPHCTAAGKA